MSGPFQRISFDEANPVMTAYGKMQDIKGRMAQNQYANLLSQSQQMSNEYQPKTMAESLQAQKLQNALSQIAVQYAPQKEQAGINNTNASTGLMGAQTNKANADTRSTNFNTANPLLNQPGVAGQLGAWAYLQQHPELLKQIDGNGGGGQQQPQGQQGQGQPTVGPDMSYWNNKQPPANPLNGLINGQTAQNQQAPMGNIAGGQPALGGSENLNDIPGLLLKSITSELKRKNAMSELTQQKSDNYSFNSLPVDHKKDILGKAGGMGIDPQEAQQRYNNGETIEDMAESQGFDPKNLPEAIYPATTTDKTRIHFRQQALSEINTIQPILTEALAPYANRVNGYSPKQIAEAISGDHPDAQARFLAAKGLMPEMSSLRIKAMGGQVGIEAIREVQSASMGNIQSFQSLVSPEVYKKAQNYMDQWINLGADKANSVGLNPEKAQNKSVGKSSSSNMVKVQAPDGRMFNVPGDQVDALLADHPDHKRAG